MIRLAWRVALFGRRAARATLAVRAAGIGLGVAILLLAAASSGALDARGDRIGWRDGGAIPASPDVAVLQVLPISDRYEGRHLQRVLVAPLVEDAPAPPGLDAVPAPGEVFVSPSLLELIEEDPEALLPRFGAGEVTGIIADAGLADANELVAIIGATEEKLSGVGVYLHEIPRGAVQPTLAVFVRILAIMGAIALLAPVALFIAATARLDAQQGEVRLAAMRLAGASSGDVRRYVAAEATLAIVPGLLVGLALFFIGRQFAPYLSFMGHGFYPGDVTLSWLSLVLLVLVPLLVVGSSVAGMRGVEVSPLGVRRGSSRRTVRPFGPVVLLGGLLLFAWGFGRSDLLAGVGVGSGVVLLLIGLTMTGPWLAQQFARILAARTRSAALLIAFRRIATDPQTSFRTVAGVSLAVFFGTLFLTVTDAAQREQGGVPPSGLRPEVLVVQGLDDTPLDLEGADAISLEYAGFLMDALGPDNPSGQMYMAYLGDCETLARVFRIEHCDDAPVLVREGSPLRAGQKLATPSEDEPNGVPFRLPKSAGTFRTAFEAGLAPSLIVSPEIWPLEDSMGILTQTVVIPHEGKAITERLRAEIIRQASTHQVLTAAEQGNEANESVKEIRQLVHLGILGAFLISGAAGAISVAGSLLARRVPFSLLRLTGCPPGVLRRALFAEAILPLLLVATLSVGVGLACGMLAIELGSSQPVEVPSSVVLPLFGGLLLGAALLTPVLPLVERVTRFSRTRFD